MTGTDIPTQFQELIKIRDLGCTGVTLRVVRELEQISADPELVYRCVTFLRCELGGYASLWHLQRELSTGELRTVLSEFAARLERAATASINTAYRLAENRPGRVITAPSSGITRQVLALLADSTPNAGDGAVRYALSGADAIGPTGVLNIVGTRSLAEKLPTMVVTTWDRFVPGDVFNSLGSPLMERIPLTQFESVVVGEEILTPAEAGHRAENSAEHYRIAG